MMTNIAYGKPYGQCNYCHKWVKLAGFFSGLHICLTLQERADIDTMRINQAKKQQAVNFVKQTEVSSLMRLLGGAQGNEGNPRY